MIGDLRRVLTLFTKWHLCPVAANLNDWVFLFCDWQVAL